MFPQPTSEQLAQLTDALLEAFNDNAQTQFDQYTLGINWRG